jgi:hypothetical protein
LDTPLHLGELVKRNDRAREASWLPVPENGKVEINWVKRGRAAKTSRNFRNKKRKYLKDKIDGLATNSINKNIRDLYRGINYFKRGYQPRSNLVKD